MGADPHAYAFLFACSAAVFLVLLAAAVLAVMSCLDRRRDRQDAEEKK